MEKIAYEFTQKEAYILGDLLCTKLIAAYQDCNLHEGNPDWSVYEEHKAFFEEIKVLFEKVRGTSAKRFIEIYEEVKTMTDNGEEVTF